MTRTRLRYVALFAVVFLIASSAGAGSVAATSTDDDQSSSAAAISDTTVSVTFDAQEINGTTVTIAEVTVPDGGFVVVTNADGDVVGHSAYLAPGTHEDVTVELDEPLDPGEYTLTATVHRDTNDDQQFDYVEGEGVDCPYTLDGEEVSDDASVTVPSPSEEETETDTETETEEETETDTETETETETDTETETETDEEQEKFYGISSVAFCTDEAGVGSADDVSVQIVDRKEDGGGPLAVSWTSNVEISTVVVKYGGPGGGSLVAYEGGTNGTTAPDEGTEIDTSENAPCPDGQTLLVKFEGHHLRTVEAASFGLVTALFVGGLLAGRRTIR